MHEINVLGQQQRLSGNQEHQNDHAEQDPPPPEFHSGQRITHHGREEHLQYHDAHCVHHGPDHGHDPLRHHQTNGSLEAHRGKLLRYPDHIGITQILNGGKDHRHQTQNRIHDGEAQPQNQNQRKKVQHGPLGLLLEKIYGQTCVHLRILLLIFHSSSPPSSKAAPLWPAPR